MGPEECTFDAAGGTQGSFGGFELGSGMTKAVCWRDWGHIGSEESYGGAGAVCLGWDGQNPTVG